MLRLLNPFGSNFNITVLVIFALQLGGEGLSLYQEKLHWLHQKLHCTL